MSNKLIDFWNCELTDPPFVHPDDKPFLWQKNGRFIHADFINLDKFIAGPLFGKSKDDRFHLSLFPVPFEGDLIRAEIVVLLLNPGFSYMDYWAEENNPEFLQRKRENLRQSFDGVDFRFLELDPKFCWHGGFGWWEKKLRRVVREIADRKFDGSYLTALRDLSRKLACIELIPYHSANFGGGSFINKLPSVKAARRYVHEALVPDTEAGKITFIILRRANVWLCDGAECKRAIVYRGGQTRGASLSPNSPGGKGILRHYGIG